MFKFGLKLWSKNENYVKEAVRLYEQGIYQYIELYVLPDIDYTQARMWKSLNIPYVIHAPHYRNGLNLTKREKKESNLQLIRKTQEIADLLKAEKIIVHPGIGGDIAETVNQLKEINEPRILIENKPYYALDDGLVCNGAVIEEIRFILDNVDVGFCLDIGHVFCTANAKKLVPLEYLKEFLKLGPKMYHLSDGDYGSVYDRHDHFGKGSYNIQSIVNILSVTCSITVETVKNFTDNLVDFEEDIKFLAAMDSPYRINLATDNDMMDVFRLSNDPVVRQNSFNPEPILIEDHVNWFKNKTGSKDCIFYIIRSEHSELIGYSRFDKCPETDTFVITIHLSQGERGKGMGYKIITQTSGMLLELNKSVEIIAYVKENNYASLKSFLKAGYELTGKAIINNSPCHKLRFYKR